MKNSKHGKFLRIHPKNHGQVDPDGGKGEFAQWHTEKANGNWKFKNHKSGKYLRIKDDKTVDVQGTGGPWTIFKAHGSGNDRKLESVKVPGVYIAVRNGQVTTGNGGPFTLFNFHRN